MYAGGNDWSFFEGLGSFRRSSSMSPSVRSCRQAGARAAAGSGTSRGLSVHDAPFVCQMHGRRYDLFSGLERRSWRWCKSFFSDVLKVAPQEHGSERNVFL